MVKISNDVLRRVVFTRAGVKDPLVIMGPRVGEDAAVLRVGDKFLITHTDPITGAVANLGWYAINIVANDVAVRGVRPRWFLLTLLLPEDFSESDLVKVMDDVDEALKELNASLIGGHTEYTPGLDRPIASVTAMGIGDRYITTGGAKVGDLVLVTKYVALEGTAVLSLDMKNELTKLGVSEDITANAQSLVRSISVVKEALALSDLASSMHDPTEGGLLQGLLEVAEASNARVRIYRDRVPMLRETEVIFNALKLDPLRSLSSGMLIAVIPRKDIDEAISRLSGLGINYAVIGEVMEGEPAVELVSDSGVEVVKGFIEDDVMRMWHSKYDSTKQLGQH
ncbi:MAG: AIR synthase family protein [Vulcanisaeta sp. AZ3]